VNGQVGSNSAQAQLIQHIEKIEKLLEDRKEINDDINDVYRLAKLDGYDRRTMASVIQLRKLSKPERIERRELLDTYLAAFGMDDE
jgi:uncharacterized protein (UPF0335 family)